MLISIKITLSNYVLTSSNSYSILNFVTAKTSPLLSDGPARPKPTAAKSKPASASSSAELKKLADVKTVNETDKAIENEIASVKAVVSSLQKLAVESPPR